MEKSKRNSGTSDGKCLIIHSQGVVNCSMLRNKSSYLCVLMFSHLIHFFKGKFCFVQEYCLYVSEINVYKY